MIENSKRPLLVDHLSARGQTAIPRIKIGVRAVGWLEEKVQEWLNKRVEASRRTSAGLVLKRKPIRDVSPR